jgi:hypothetical protein
MVGNIESSGSSSGSSGGSGGSGGSGLDEDGDGEDTMEMDIMEDFDDGSFIQGYDTSWTPRPQKRRTQRVEEGFIFVEEDEAEGEGEGGGGGGGEGEGEDVVDTVEQQLITGLFDKFKESSQSIDDFLGDAYDQLEKTSVRKGIEGEVTLALRLLLGLVAKKKDKEDSNKD